MKTLLFFAIPLLLLNFGCKTTSGPGNTNTSDTTFSYAGADYFPLADNILWTAHIKGTAERLDQNGVVYETDETDADYKASLGLIELREGRDVFPVFTYDSSGRRTNDGESVGFAALLDSVAVGFNNYDAVDAATILPRTLSVGMTWTPAPEALPIQCNATLVKRFGSYTNTGGTSYNDVIQVHVVYLDSTSNYGQKFSANADLYFARNVGLVEADVHSFEFLDNSYDFAHSLGSGVVYRKN